MNAYILIDPQSDTGVIIDPGADADAILAATGGASIQRILLTHTDRDHIGALPEVVAATGAPVAGHADAAGPLPEPPGEELRDGDVIKLGAGAIHVIETPGHAPDHVGGDVLCPVSIRPAFSCPAG